MKTIIIMNVAKDAEECMGCIPIPTFPSHCFIADFIPSTF